MSRENNVGVALTKCFFCGADDKIVMNSLLTERMKSNVEKMHGMVIDMDPCHKCKDLMKQGVIIITIDNSRSEKDWNKEQTPNPYRTGGWFVVKDRFFEGHDGVISRFALKHRFMFMEDEVARKLGFFDVTPSEGVE